MKSDQIIPKEALGSNLVKLFCVKYILKYQVSQSLLLTEKEIERKSCFYLHILIMFAILLAN